MKNARIFWICSLVQKGDGYYYHMFYNWLILRGHIIFAGYYKNALNRKTTSWNTLKEKLKEK